MRTLYKAMCFVVTVLTGATALGDIAFDAAQNVIWVNDFPESAPAMLPQILAADQARGWGKVAYDAASDTYTVAADLWIGDDKSRGAFLQIGTTERPRETLVMAGSIWILPPKSSPLRTDGRRTIVNRLTLGDPENSNIHARLLFACGKPGQYGLYVGKVEKTKRTPGGDLWVYNSEISVLTPGWSNIFDNSSAYKDLTVSSMPNEVRLINARLSWFGFGGSYGANANNSVIQGSVFEHGKAVVGNGEQLLRGCAFRDVGVAIREGGCLSARLVNCSFADNDYNWTLGSASSGDIVLIDCEVGPQKKPISLQKNTMTPVEAQRMKRSLYPSCIEQQSIVVKVTDEAGTPLPEALAQLQCEADPRAVIRGAAMTDQNGLTPDNPEETALLATVRMLQATDDPKQPVVSSYQLRLSIRKTGYQTATIELDPAGKWPRPLKVVMKSLSNGK